MRRVAVSLGALAALAYAAALALASAPSSEARLRSRIAAALEARVAGVELGAVEVDALFRVRVAPLRLTLRGGAGAVSIERVVLRPSVLALLAGRAEPGAATLEGVRLSGPVALGPFGGEVRRWRDAGGERLAAALRLPGGGRARLEVTRDGGGWRARLSDASLGPGDLPASPGAALRALTGALAVEVDARASPDLSAAVAEVRLSAHDVRVTGPRVGADTVGPLLVRAAGRLVWRGGERRLRLEDGAVTLQGAVPLALSGELRAGPGLPFSLSLRADEVDYAALVAALPPGLAPPPEAPRPPGAFALRLDASGPLSRPRDWTLDAALDLSRLRAAARRAPPVALRGPFVHRPAGDPSSAVVVGPDSPDFVPLAELPAHVVRAVTTSEDAGFFAHAGFDFDELRNALAEGAEAGRVVRGGSTITQQLAKNLYLSQERTLARKVREAVITVGLEASVPKRRLLEIYLNVVEWGPGVHGIGPAARHWFGKDARALTPKEAAFLASVIPAPVRYHAMYERGFASKAWEARVNDLLVRMTEHGVLTDEELAEGLGAPLWFAGG